MGAKWSLGDTFGPVSREAWRAQVERELKGKPFERLITKIDQDIEVPPLATADDWPLRPRAHVGAHGWESRARASTRAAAFEAIEGGADGVVIPGPSLPDTLKDLPLDRATVTLSASAWTPDASAHLLTLVDDLNITPAGLELGFDPLGTLATQGSTPPGATDAMVEAAIMASARTHVRAVRVDTGPYHDAGADEVQDLAIAAATGLAYLRAMASGGLDLDAAIHQIVFHLRVESAFFTAIAKLRALRLIWGKIAQSCGVEQSTAHLWVSSAQRIWTRRDPWVNMLRNTACLFAATVGGADAITSLSYDAATTLNPSPLGRRVARNTPTILAKESHLDRVLDPAGGSWFIERLTDKLAVSAWALFQDIEAQGGAEAALRSGHLHTMIKNVAQTRDARIAHRKRAITGVSAFPNLHEPRPPSPDPAPPNTDTQLPPLRPTRLAEPFEAMRDRSDDHLDATGARPRVLSVNLGPIAQHTARAGFARNLLEAGGFEVLATDPLDTPDHAAAALTSSGAKLAVICANDALYTKLAAPVCAALSAAGAQAIILAGRPGALEAPLTEAGLTGAMFAGCDALALLDDLWAATAEDDR